MSEALPDLTRLFRPRVGLLATAGVLAGFLARTAVAPAPHWSGLVPVLAGSTLLAWGCSALNQVQEREADGRMARTRNRPLPAGRLTPVPAAGLGLACLLGGLILLGLGDGPLTAGLAGLTILVYNGLYTPLKKRTALALLVGGVAGAVPPLLGWSAAGGSPLEAQALALFAIFYSWQVPHFWLFARMHREDYLRAGFRVPEPGRLAGRPDLGAGLWIVTYCACLLAAPALALPGHPAMRWGVAALALSLAACTRLILSRVRLGFILVNASLALFLLGLAADALRLVTA